MSLFASTMSMFDSSVWKNGHSRAIACSSAMPSSGCACDPGRRPRRRNRTRPAASAGTAPSRTPRGSRADPRSASISCVRPAGCRCADWRSRRSPSSPRNTARIPASRRPARDRPGRRAADSSSIAAMNSARGALGPAGAAAPPRASPRRGCSRFCRPSSGLRYFPAITSPCSVTRMPACTAPAGCARMAS